VGWGFQRVTGVLETAEESNERGVPLTEPGVSVGVARDFDEFYREEFRTVVGLAYALSGSRTGAEDMAQDAFLAAHRNWDRIGHYEQPGAWVRRVVANLAVSSFRRRITEARALVRLAGRQRPQVTELPGQDDEFWAAVRSLPRRQAQSLALHYLEDLPVAQIGRILDCAEGTVKAHLYKARQSLARRLGVPEEESS
jgi:RNA polymerase sigma-70 factor (sigma-E family)